MRGPPSYEACGAWITRGFTESRRTQRTQSLSCSREKNRCVLVLGGDVNVGLPRTVVLKFGGELLEDRAHLATVVGAVSSIAAAGAPLAIVHGAGKEIDAALK